MENAENRIGKKQKTRGKAVRHSYRGTFFLLAVLIVLGQTWIMAVAQKMETVEQTTDPVFLHIAESGADPGYQVATSESVTSEAAAPEQEEGVDAGQDELMQQENTMQEKQTQETGADSFEQTADKETADAIAASASVESDEPFASEDANVEAVALGSSGILTSMERDIQNAGLSLSNVLSYDWIVPQFYVVNAGTSVTPEVLNPTVLLSKDVRIHGSSDAPQILLYHTHSQEAYADSIPGDKSQTIVGVGDYLAELLTNKYGYQVIHHTGEYDVTDGKLDRDPAYSRALPALEQILAENPSIECIIDLHRDGVADNVRLVTEIDGQPAAQIMWFNGLCRDENGYLPGIAHSWLETNLALSLQLRVAAMSSYPGLTRFNYLKSMRYNQHLRMSALIEVGAQTNTVSEAMNTIPALADLLDQVLSGK